MFDTTISHSVDSAQAAILATVQALQSIETVAIQESLGRVVATDYVVATPIPAFANSAMDGYALQAVDLVGLADLGSVRLQVVEHAPAGKPAQRLVERGTAIRIMTGAPIPDGADTVIPFEDTDEIEHSGEVRDFVEIRVVHRIGAHIRAAGEALQSGICAVATGTLIHPGVIAVLATMGIAEIAVFKRPKVAILATGDELVALEQPLQYGQIYNSNSYALAAQIYEAGGEPLLLPIVPDAETALLTTLAQAKTLGADLVLSSGGVSVGDYDVVRTTMVRYGSMELWKVRMRPGKPVMFGFIYDMPLLGLPGNPVSAMVCFELFGRPLIRTMLGMYPVIRQPVMATFVGKTIERALRRQYIRVYVHATPTGLEVTSTGAQGSGIIRSMAEANGLLIIEEGQGFVQSGEFLPVLLLHDILPA